MKRHLFGISSLLLTTLTAFGQGDLNPPGAPGATMKTLDQLDAKLNQAITKVEEANGKAEKRTPISSLPFTIRGSGSYYLTGNLTGTSGQDGITITASNVTVDLNGFELVGGGGVSGIIVPSEQKNITIRNGVVRDWLGIGIQMLLTSSSIVNDVRVSGNVSGGIRGGNHTIVHACTASNNAGGGIRLAQAGIISRCTVTGTTGNGAYAIYVDDGGAIIESVARGNSSPSGIGIFAGSGCSIIRCESTGNSGMAAGIQTMDNSRIVDCTSSGNSGANSHGIIGGNRVHISGSNAAQNGIDGIRFGSDSVILNNSASNNPGDGIEVLGARNRVEGNHLTSNGVGLRMFSAATLDNLVIRNSAAASTSNNFVLISGNAHAPVVSQAAIANGSNTNPHANFDLD